MLSSVSWLIEKLVPGVGLKSGDNKNATHLSTGSGGGGRKHQMNLALNLKEQLCAELRLREGRNESFRFTKQSFKKNENAESSRPALIQ